MTSISCTAPGNCSAVGDYFDDAHNREGLLLSESDGAWSTGIEAGLPSPHATGIGQQRATLTGLSCVSAGNCTASGSYNDAGYFSPTTNVVFQQAGGSWSKGANMVLPSNHAHVQANDLTAVDCLSASDDCTAVGGYTDLAGDLQSMAVNGIGAGPASELRAPPTDKAEIGQSLVNLNPVYSPTVGQLLSADGEAITYWAPAQGLLTDSWSAKISGQMRVIGTLRKHIDDLGANQVKLTLNPLGRKLIAHARMPLMIRGKAAIAPNHGPKRSLNFTVKVVRHGHVLNLILRSGGMTRHPVIRVHLFGVS